MQRTKNYAKTQIYVTSPLSIDIEVLTLLNYFFSSLKILLVFYHHYDYFTYFFCVLRIPTIPKPKPPIFYFRYQIVHYFVFNVSTSSAFFQSISCTFEVIFFPNMVSIQLYLLLTVVSIVVFFAPILLNLLLCRPILYSFV